MALPTGRAWLFPKITGVNSSPEAPYLLNTLVVWAEFDDADPDRRFERAVRYFSGMCANTTDCAPQCLLS